MLSLNPNIVEQIKKQLKRQTWLLRFYQIIATIVLPLVIAVLVNLWTGAQTPNEKYYFLRVLVVIGVVQILMAALQVSTDKPISQFLVEFDDLIKAKEKDSVLLDVRKSDILRLGDIQAITIKCLAELQELNNQEKVSVDEICNRVLDPWVAYRYNIFGFQEGNALWNFAVYKVNSTITPNKLEQVWRRCDDRLKRTDRAWDVGDGHVGRCYQLNKILITPPLLGAEGATMIEHLRPSQERVEDGDYYNSFMATPISVNRQNWGVFVVTSSKHGQFNEEDHSQIADVVGMLLAQGLTHNTGG